MFRTTIPDATAKKMIGICSDNPEFYLIVAHILEVEGFDTVPASNISDAVAEDSSASALVLDCRADNTIAAEYTHLKRQGILAGVPAVAFIAAGAYDQHFEVLRSGVEGCLVRPLDPSHLIATVRSITGGNAKPEQPPTDLIGFEDIEMHTGSHRVFRNGEEIKLRPIEFRLLQYMLEQPERVVSRSELISAGWPGHVYVGERTVDVHISRLRKALNRNMRCDVIRTVRLGGYSLQRSALNRI
jgi:two-component system, OmpR family, phosphate regulon response regulator PhoB